TPVMSKDGRTKAGGTQRLLGYVVVGVSQGVEIAQAERANSMIIAVGCLAIIISIPFAYMLVRRIFLPVRELVEMTKKIAAGNLEARVSTQRRDVIGDLARSFNEMVLRVKEQQQAVAAVNHQLAEANRDLEQKVEQRTAQVETALKRLSSEIAEKEDF